MAKWIVSQVLCKDNENNLQAFSCVKWHYIFNDTKSLLKKCMFKLTRSNPFRKNILIVVSNPFRKNIWTISYSEFFRLELNDLNELIV